MNNLIKQLDAGKSCWIRHILTNWYNWNKLVILTILAMIILFLIKSNKYWVVELNWLLLLLPLFLVKFLILWKSVLAVMLSKDMDSLRHVVDFCNNIMIHRQGMSEDHKPIQKLDLEMFLKWIYIILVIHQEEKFVSQVHQYSKDTSWTQKKLKKLFTINGFWVVM